MDPFDSEKRKHGCEICGRVFASRQSKHRHVQRFHTLATSTPSYSEPVDIDAINKRISALEENVRASNTEISLLHEKRDRAINNTFSHINATTLNTGTMTGCTFTTNLTLNLHTNSHGTDGHASGGGGDPPPGHSHLDVQSMVPFGANFDEFVSPAQMKAIGYSIVRLLQLTHFNPDHPEHMNFLSTPDMQAFALGSDRNWTKVDLNTSILELLKKLGQRVAAANPLEGLKYEDEVAFIVMGANSISMNAIKGIRDHSPMAVKKLTQLGIVLPSELIPLT